MIFFWIVLFLILFSRQKNNQITTKSYLCNVKHVIYKNHFWFFIFLVTLATGFVSFSICYHFLCKMFTNFSPIRHVNDVEGTYFVKKINIYLIKNSFVFTSRHSRIKEFMLSAAHFRFNETFRDHQRTSGVYLASI